MLGIGPCSLVGKAADLLHPANAGPRSKLIGPFGNSQEYMNALLGGQAMPQDKSSKGIHKLLRMMIKCLPSFESDPSMYGYSSISSSENFPEELDIYRQWYAERIRSLVLPGDTDLTLKSHLFEALWIAASSLVSIDNIIQKVFLCVFPAEEEVKDDVPLYLYETAVALADNCLDEGAQKRIFSALKNFLSFPND